jgi:hypothetical protein
MVKTRPQSLAALAETDGFGKAKLEKYGPDILAILAHVSKDHQHQETLSEAEETGDGHPQR